MVGYLKRALFDYDSRSCLGAASEEQLAKYKKALEAGKKYVVDTRHGYEYKYYVLEQE